MDKDSALKTACLKMVMFYIVVPNNTIIFSNNVCDSSKNIFNDSPLAKQLSCRRTKTTFILNEM